MRSLVVGLTLIASTAAAEPTPTVKPVANVILTLAPVQRWKELPGKQIGVLHAQITRWGVIDGRHMSAREIAQLRKAPAKYSFRTDTASSQALYFPAKKGEGHNFLSNWGVPLPKSGDAHYDAAQFGPTTKNRWGLRRSIHLVEVEVNGGRGAAPNIHFVATATKILEGTPEFPIQPERALDDAKARWDRYLASQRKMLADALAAAGRATPGKPFGKETDDINAVSSRPG